MPSAPLALIPPFPVTADVPPVARAAPAPTPTPRPAAAGPQPVELAYTVSLVRTPQELAEVRALRGRAYERVLPGLGAHFARPDPADEAPGTLLYAARDKATGALIGSSRVRTNRCEPLAVQASVDLPAELHGHHLAEVTRYVVDADYKRDAPQRGLLKAMALTGHLLQVRAFVITAREKMVRRYKALGLELLLDGQAFPMAHIGGLPHCVMAFDLHDGLQRLRQMQHPISPFIEEQWHPDLRVLEDLLR
ncbi:MAG: N-acyl amino acid synthase FeeM domain-containing protein [Pseudomonadota bacterium]